MGKEKGRMGERAKAPRRKAMEDEKPKGNPVQERTDLKRKSYKKPTQVEE